MKKLSWSFADFIQKFKETDAQLSALGTGLSTHGSNHEAGGSDPILPIRLSGTDNLNDVVNEGTYTTAGAGADWAADNYPSPAFGTIIVTVVGTPGGNPTVQQTFLDAIYGQVYIRRRELDVWKPWLTIGPTVVDNGNGTSTITIGV